MVVDERLVGSPDYESLQLLHKSQVISPVGHFPRSPLETVTENAGIESAVRARQLLRRQSAPRVPG